MADGLQMSRRIRRTPYTDRVEALGVRGYTVVNHTLLPKAFQHTVQEDYWHLRTQVQLWDVGCQRQVEISGPDASRLVQWMTPRDISGAAVGDCVYTPLVDRHGFLVNDPICIKFSEDRYWLSIADTDVALYALGLASGAGLDVSVSEPDIWPLAVQGPRAEDVLAAVYGDALRSIGYFKTGWITVDGAQCLIARSGYSGQGGFEVYADPATGKRVWDAVWEAGQDLGIRPGCPNLIDRIETGLLSFGNEMTRTNHPLESGLARWCDLDRDIDCLGHSALRAIAQQGVSAHMQGVTFDAPKELVCTQPWPVMLNGSTVGVLTSAIHSPRLQRHVGLGILATTPETEVTVQLPDGNSGHGRVQSLPFTDHPKVHT